MNTQAFPGQTARFNPSNPGRPRVGIIYPSGRFAVVQTFRSKRGTEPSRVTRDEKAKMHGMPAPDGSTYNSVPTGNAPLLGLLSLARNGFPLRRETPGHLGSSNAVISRKRGRRGSRGINPKQRDSLQYWAGYLEWRHSKRLLSFLTVTIPPLPPDALKRVQDAWGTIVNRFVEWIKRSLLSKGIKTDVIGATEIQVKRAGTTGQVYPHLHLLFRGRASRSMPWAMSPLNFRVGFRRILANTAKIEIGEDRAIENVVGVKKSVARYLSKYLSKCASKTGDAIALQWHPADWVILGRAFRKRWKQLTRRGDGILADQICDFVFGDTKPPDLWIQPIELRFTDNVVRIGWSGSTRSLRREYSEAFPRVL